MTLVPNHFMSAQCKLYYTLSWWSVYFFLFIERFLMTMRHWDSEPTNRMEQVETCCMENWSGEWHTSNCLLICAAQCTGASFNVSQELYCLPSGRQRETNCLPAERGWYWAPDAWDRRGLGSTHGHRNAELWEKTSFRERARKQKVNGG